MGVTGGIASGKSTVAGELGRLGAFVIDADQIGRDVIAPQGPAYEEVLARFGPTILDEDRKINRAALAGIVFFDPQALSDLQAITHPHIFSQMRKLASAAKNDGYEVIVFDAPLIVETLESFRDDLKLDALIWVKSPPELQLQRLRRAAMPEDQIAGRMAAQATDERRMAAPHILIENDGTLDELFERVRKVWAEQLKG